MTIAIRNISVGVAEYGVLKMNITALAAIG